MNQQGQTQTQIHLSKSGSMDHVHSFTIKQGRQKDQANVSVTVRLWLSVTLRVEPVKHQHTHVPSFFSFISAPLPFMAHYRHKRPHSFSASAQTCSYPTSSRHGTAERTGSADWWAFQRVRWHRLCWQCFPWVSIVSGYIWWGSLKYCRLCELLGDLCFVMVTGHCCFVVVVFLFSKAWYFLDLLPDLLLTSSDLFFCESLLDHVVSEQNTQPHKAGRGLLILKWFCFHVSNQNVFHSW